MNGSPYAVAIVLLLGSAVAIAAPKPRKPKSAYPKAPTSNQVDDYHGTKVADPYRPLENPDSPETRAWIEKQNERTEAYLASAEDRPAIRERLTRLWNFERYSPPFREGGRYFYTKNDGLQNQAVLYTKTTLEGEPKTLLDPNVLSPDGTVALTDYQVSKDGKHLAYGVAFSGSDWNDWRVRNVETGVDTQDLVRWVKFSSVTWTADSKGFFYGRYEQPKEGTELEAVLKNQRLYYHRLGTPQGSDVLVYERPDEPELGFGPTVTDDGRYLVLFVWQGTDRRNRLYVRDLSEPNAPFLKLFDAFDAGYTYVGNDGPTFFVRTDLDAPKGRLVSVNLSEAGEAKPKLTDVIPEGDVLESVSLVGERFIATVMKDASHHAFVYTLAGQKEKEIELPALGALGGFAGKRDEKETFYAFTSFTYPTTIFRYDFTTGKSTVIARPNVDFDPASFETTQVFYPSKDGTKVPLFLVHRKGLKLDGQNPTYLYGYGGFNVPLPPAFSVKNLAWMEMGGVYAQACLRGGSEYGEAWHEAGMQKKKQNVFDDFAWAAKWLVKKKYTSPKRLSIGGGSNGGLLVGATLNQHPTLFGAAVPAVGVMDMLRFHKFTIGWAWVAEYGTSEKPEDFRNLMTYSPLHNMKKGAKYPAVMVTTADHDDRVVPAHSFKYTAALQAAQGGPAPILIRVETKAGHGAGKPTTKLIEEGTDVLAFLSRALGGTRPLTLPKGM